VPGFPGSSRTTKELWRLSEAVTPRANAGEFTQAIMDLGATLCTRANPACERCPIGGDCRAHTLGRTADFPAVRPPRARPHREVVWLVLKREGAYLLEQRPASGIWGGLWGFPEFANRAQAESALQAAGGHLHAPAGSEATITHSFSHFDLTITPLIADVAIDAARVMEGPPHTWYNSRAPASLGLAAPVSTLLRELESEGDAESTS